jgi:hypothetical protein
LRATIPGREILIIILQREGWFAVASRFGSPVLIPLPRVDFPFWAKHIHMVYVDTPSSNIV